MNALKDLFLKKIDEALFLHDEIPLLRGESFDLKAISEALKKELGWKDFEITFQKMAWDKTENIFQSFGTNPFQLCLSLTPLIGSFYWIIGQNELNEIITNSFAEESKAKNLSVSLKEGFSRYLAIRALNLLQKQKSLFQGLNFKIIEHAKIQTKNALCIDFKITINQKTVFSRLALTPDFRISWNQHQHSQPSLFFSSMKKNLQLPLSFILAETTLTATQLETIQKGDFLLLDKIYFDPKTNIDRVKVQLHSIPLFQVKLKKEKMEIIDFAQLEENIMPDSQNSPKPEDSTKELTEPEKEESLTKEEPQTTATAPKKSEAISIKELPLTLTVELAKMQMPLSEMTALQPGNSLELPSSVEEGVSLCVNGKKIAKGELIHIGEKLGVRILEIG